MKLAALGLLTLGIGLLISAPGLVGIGAYWVLTGFLVRALAPRTALAQRMSGARDRAAPDVPAPVLPSGGQIVVGNALLALIALPSIAVGAMSIGFDADDAAWRWIPLVVGGYAAVIAVLSTILQLLAVGVSAAADLGPEPTVPAVILIRSVEETGMLVNQRPRLEFRLRVEPAPGSGWEPWEVTKRATVPFTALTHVRVGAGFRATVAGPERPTSMTINWNRPIETDSDHTRP